MKAEVDIQPEAFAFEAEPGEFEAGQAERPDTWQQEQNRGSADYVRWLQTALNQVLGLRLAVDGMMGPQTRSAIRSFQQRQGLVVDGIVGPMTEAALKRALTTSIAPPTTTSGTQICAELRQPEVLDNFEFDRDRVRPHHQPQIQRIAQCIVASQRSSQPVRQVRLVGHTDPVGDPGYNLGLGRRRADRVGVALREAIDGMQTGLSGRLTFLVETRGEDVPIPGNSPASRRVEVFVAIPTVRRDVERDLDEVLRHIRREAQRLAALRRSVDPRSQFVRVLASRYLARYLAAPSAATARAAISAIARQNTSGVVTIVCGAPDFWERATPSFNGISVPVTLRGISVFRSLPANIGAATDILRVANRRTLSHIDVPFLLGARTLDLLDCSTRADRARDPDLQANNSINESQLMHWATGAKFAQLGRDPLRDFFLAYELWHLELWDVFGHDPINDMIAEDAARHMADEIRSLRLNRSNLIATLNAGFEQARAWVGALLRLRRAALDRQIKADPPPSAFMHWRDEIPATSPDHPYREPSIRRMLVDGVPLSTVKASPVVQRYIEVYTLLFEATVWERTNGRVPLTPTIRLMATGRLNQLFRAIAEAERNPPTLLRRDQLTREL